MSHGVFYIFPKFQRANYQTWEWKNALVCDHIYIDPIEHGWQRKSNGLIEIKWTTLNAGPDSLLEFMVCNCKKSKCTTNACKCRRVSLRCTDLCGCKGCKNVEDSSNESENETSEESEISDYDDDDDISVLEEDSDDMDSYF